MATRRTRRKLPPPEPSRPKPRDPVDPNEVSLRPGKGSKGRGGDPSGTYWHVEVGDKRAGYIYINLIDEPPVGPHASVQIQLNIDAQGRGIGSVAYRLAVESSGLATVYAHMRKSNVASRRAAENAGFSVVDDPTINQLLMVWKRSS